MELGDPLRNKTSIRICYMKPLKKFDRRGDKSPDY